MKVRYLFTAMFAALCAVAFSACDSDEPGANTDPEVPETPEEPAEQLTDEIRPVLTDGKKWVFDVFTLKNPEGGKNSTYCVAGDTDINGVTAKKIYSTSDIEVLMREENGLVSSYWKIETSYDMPITYDFLYSYDIDPEEGEFLQGSPSSILIASKGTIELMGKTRRAVLVKDIRFYGKDHLGAYIYDLWVEGIGPLFGALLQHQWIVPSTPKYTWWPVHHRLLECYDGDEKIYDYREFTPERYKPEVVFNEADADAYDIMKKMLEGSLVKEYLSLFGSDA